MKKVKKVFSHIGYIEIDGRCFGPDEFHRISYTFPVRLVVKNTPKGWNRCACGREFRVWMTSDRVWNKLPKKYRKQSMCVYCFRGLCPSGVIL